MPKSSCVLSNRSYVAAPEVMSTIQPFAALRPKPDLAGRICELPYDVMSSEEARRIAAGNPLSFLHVSKPEIDLPPATDLYAPEVYAKGKENFAHLMREGALRQAPHPAYYLYRQVMGGHSQVGLVAVASCQQYLEGKIKKHEFTRPDKEDDRVRHIEALEAQTGPVFLVYRARPSLDELVRRETEATPEIDFTAADGVRHSAWTIRTPLERVSAEFAAVPALYIADGHHRCAAAARVCQARNGAGHSAWFLSVIFADHQVQILPYNRVIKDLNGLGTEQFLEKLDGVFTLSVSAGAPVSPSRKHQLGLYLAGQWRTLHFRPRFAATTDPVEALDVTLLQKYVLAPLLGIEDPRTSKRLNFVGGIRGTAELERLVNSGEFACALSLFPTSIADLMAIADAGGIMPPKSTWFEPKLRDALFCHLL